MANWKSTLILNKWENGSLRKFGTILFVSAAFSGCVFWGNSYSTPGELFSDKELFSGFSILNMPREDISLGSRWQQGIGPSDKGLSETDLLITASLKETDFSHSNSFKVRAGIIASLKRLYSLEIGGNISESEVISLGEADIVRVKNFKSLKLASGGYYVWEGIRLKSFTLETHRSHAQSLMAKALNVFPGASISLEENETGRAFLKIKE